MIERAVSVSLMASVCILAAAIPASARPWDALVPGVVVEAKADWTSSGDLRIGKARVRVEGRQDRAEIIAPWEGILNGDALLAGCAIPMLDSVRANAGGITPGIWVEADLERAGEVGWVAYRVRPTGSDHHDDIEVEGPIESLNAKGRAVIAGIPVRFSRSAEILNAAHLEADRPSLFFEEVDDDDAVLSGIRTLSGRVKMGGSLRADFEPEENLNLNPARPADLHRSWWAAELQLEAAPGARHRAFVKFGSRSTVVHRDDENQRTNQTDWQFKQGFWLWSPAAAPSWA
ncbi:MAG: hypothetical protein HKN20_13125, partial [Gemmatimonadetes bacterium]|nr:hypothetical protein [Gemmatimonadota bacterium]